MLQQVWLRKKEQLSGTVLWKSTKDSTTSFTPDVVPNPIGKLIHNPNEGLSLAPYFTVAKLF